MSTIPNPNLSFTPFDPLAAANLNKLVANDNSLDTTGISLASLIAALPQADGWIVNTDSLTFSSYDSTNKTGVITAPTDATTKYQNGDKFKFLNNGTTQHAFVTKVTATAVTLYFGTDYSLTNSAITLPYYSRDKSPFGFPLDPAKWTVSVVSSASRATSSASFASLTDNIVVPIGAWRLSCTYYFEANFGTVTTGRAVGVSMSSSGTTETNPKLTAISTLYDQTSAQHGIGDTHKVEDFISVTTATTFTAIGFTAAGSMNLNVGGLSQTHNSYFDAICAYL